MGGMAARQFALGMLRDYQECGVRRGKVLKTDPELGFQWQ